MTWPRSRLLVFSDGLPPFVDATFLNAVQDEVGRAARTTTRVEPWAFDPADTPVGGYLTGVKLPDERWVSFGVGAGAVYPLGPTLDFPWAHLLVEPNAAAPGDTGAVSSSSTLVRFNASYKQRVELEVQRAVLGPGAGDSQIFVGFGVSTATRYALFSVDWGATDVWKCMTHDGAAATTTVTAVAIPSLTTARARLRVDLVGSLFTGGERAEFYVDDVLVATHTTNLPNVDALYFLAAVTTAAGDTQSLRVGPLALSSESVL